MLVNMAMDVLAYLFTLYLYSITSTSVCLLVRCVVVLDSMFGSMVTHVMYLYVVYNEFCIYI